MDLDLSDDDAERRKVRRPHLPADAAAPSDAQEEEEEQQQEEPIRQPPHALRKRTLSPPPVGWRIREQAGMIIMADGATAGDKAFAAELGRRSGDNDCSDDDNVRASNDAAFSIKRSDVRYWNGDSLSPFFGALRTSDGKSFRGEHSFGFDAEWCVQASPARPRPGESRLSSPYLVCTQPLFGVHTRCTGGAGGGKIAVLSFFFELPVLGKHVHVVSLKAYEDSDSALSDSIREEVEELLDSVSVIGHNVQGDITRLSHDFDLSPCPTIYDSMNLAKKLLGPRQPWNPLSK